MTIVKPFNPRWEYTGDMNLEYGGLYWRPGTRDTFPEMDYVEAVEVLPVSDMGGPDNVYIITTGSIYLGEDNRDSALSCCGYSWAEDENGLGYVLDTMGGAYPVNRRMGLTMLVDAYKAYHGMDADAMNGETVIRIGSEVDPDDISNGGDAWEGRVSRVYRANRKLERIVREEFL